MPQPHDLVHPERSFQSLSNAHGDAWAMGLFSHILPYVCSFVDNMTDPQAEYVLQRDPNSPLQSPQLLPREGGDE
jgi:hypothetical protein